MYCNAACVQAGGTDKYKGQSPTVHTGGCHLDILLLSNLSSCLLWLPPRMVTSSLKISNEGVLEHGLIQ